MRRKHVIFMPSFLQGIAALDAEGGRYFTVSSASLFTISAETGALMSQSVLLLPGKDVRGFSSLEYDSTGVCVCVNMCVCASVSLSVCVCVCECVRAASLCLLLGLHSEHRVCCVTFVYRDYNTWFLVQ
jgi:hypothetical protein